LKPFDTNYWSNVKVYFRIHRLKEVPSTYNEPLAELSDPKNKLITIAGRKFMSALLSKKDPYRETSEFKFYFLDENIATTHFFFAFRRTCPYTKTFIRKIDQLISAGIVQKVEIEGKKIIEREVEKKQLTMDELSVCFIIVAICLGISFIVFVGECLTPRVMSIFSGRS
jgi:hypothetical protein